MARKSRLETYTKKMQEMKKDNGIVFSDNTLKNEASIMKQLKQMKMDADKAKKEAN